MLFSQTYFHFSIDKIEVNIFRACATAGSQPWHCSDLGPDNPLFGVGRTVLYHVDV